MKTYLELVNMAIEESGVDLDLLSTDSSTPIDWNDTTGYRMHKRFKEWVKQAWQDIQLEREEWEFRSGHLTTTILPRLYVEEGERAGGEPPVGSVFVGRESGYQFTVLSVQTLSGDWTLGTATAIIQFEDPSGAIDGIFGEVFNEIDPAPANAVFRYTYWARYNFRDQVSSLAEVDPTSFSITGNAANGLPLKFVPWGIWQQHYEATNLVRAQPALITITHDGLVDFYPRPERPYTITFTYNRAPQIFSDPDDLPLNLDPFYHDQIAWRAVIYYAMYDKNADVLGYAKVRHGFYKNRLERTTMPIVTFGESLYNE